MKQIRHVVVVAWLILAAPGGQARMPAQAPAGELGAAIAAIDARITSEFAKDGAGAVSIGVVSGSKLVWSKHYGYAEAEAKRAPDNDTAFRIGSITKQFTVLALLQLVEQGRMRLSDPIEKYVPEVKAVQGAPPNAAPITLLQVATMMSGLAREPGCANHSVGPVSVWQKKVLDCLPQTRYEFEPGTQYLYSNIGYATLGLAIERAGGAPFIAQVEERIFKPLGMTRSSFEPTPALRTNLAHGYARASAGAAPSRARADAELEGRGYRVPNGAIFSTITDLAKFVAWELGDGPALIKKETQDANYLRVYSATDTRNALSMTSGYGLGFQVQRRGDVVMLGHGGSTAGYLAAALFNRAKKIGVVVLRNCDSCPIVPTSVAAYSLELLHGK
jgi:CubicO group peptidase (beta-lactamase class C family)